jgi:drug/metabolite transporter (DMT)-like permease
MLIKISLREVPPLWLTFLRVAIGLVMVLIFYPRALRGARKVLRENYGVVLISSALNIALPFSLCNLGEYYVASSMAGIIEGCVPVFTLLLGLGFSSIAAGKKAGVSRAHTAALVLGFMGILVIFHSTLAHQQWGSGRGIALLLVMALTFAAGFIWYEARLRTLPFANVLVLQLSGALCYLLPLAYYGEPEFSFATLINLSSETIIALLILGFAGTSIGLVLFYAMLSRYGAQFASLVTYLCLVLGIFWGVFFLDEQLSVFTYGGAGLIVVSMVCASYERTPTWEHGK